MVDGHDLFEGMFEPPKRIDIVFFADDKEGVDPVCFAASCEPAKR